MAYTPGPRNRPDFPLRSENASPAGFVRTSSTTPSGTKTHSALGQRGPLDVLNVGALQNISQNAQQKSSATTTVTPARKSVLSSVEAAAATPDSLANDLENFHIRSPRRDSDASVNSTGTCESRGVTVDPASSSPPPPPLQAPASGLLSSLEIRDTLYKHDAGEFDCILSLPRDAGNWTQSDSLRRICSAADLAESASPDHEVHFGCNFVQQRSLSKSDATGQVRAVNAYTLVATSLGSSPTATAEQDAASGTLPAAADMTGMHLAPEGTGPTMALSADGQIGLSPRARAADEDAHSIPRSPCSSVSRIEDTIEELDKLEDEFEAVKQMVEVDRVPSPEKTRRPKPATAKAKTTAKPVGTRGTTTQVPTTAATGVSNKRLSMARPASLLPPKPLAKSSKPPTKSTFELPGEVLTRRMKEQREARQAAAAAEEAAAVAARKARLAARPKQPTIPTFELPGEAISRRKREKQQEKLRQQEEEERQRRAFKARPIRFSITPSTVPRDTISSRARLNRASIVGAESLGGAVGPGAAGNKRLSVASFGSLNRSAGMAGPAAEQSPRGRGRGSTPGSLSAAEHTSRAASTSTGSVSGVSGVSRVSGISGASGPRSSVSVDGMHGQKPRGKENHPREHVLLVDREREQRERAAATKQARQEAAERSRALSRAWAEKQKQRAKKEVMAGEA